MANALNFLPQVNYTTGSYPWGITTGDFNGDNKIDLAVTNAGSDNISVLLGNGNGTFQAQVNYAVKSWPIGITPGDFNGDNKIDLAVANAGSDNISVLLGNGNGTFQAQVNYAVKNYPIGITPGDFNGDNKIDLAVTNYSSANISVLLGNGNGTFQAQVNYAVKDAPYGITPGDFNGDNKIDLAVANYSSANISVLLGNGNGTFQAQVNYAVKDAPYGITPGDFNGDNKIDLAVANYSSANISVLLGNGNGTFQAQVNYAVKNNPYEITPGDFNGDNKIDLAVANYSSANISVLLGNGNGTFQAQVNYAVKSWPIGITPGDFNGDNKIDLAVANYSSANISVLINDATIPLSNIVAGAQTLNEDTPLTFFAALGNSLGINGGAASVTVTLGVTQGVLTLGNTAGLTFSKGDGQDDAQMVFSGTSANINNALKGLKFLPKGNYSGPAALTLASSDAFSSDSDTVALTIRAVNDAPSGAVKISGVPQLGKILSASNTLKDADGLGAISYTWKSGATVLGTGNTYAVTDQNLEQSLTVTASYTDQGGRAESVTSAATAKVSFIKAALLIDGTTLYLANGSNGLQIKDVTNPNQAGALGSYDTSGIAHDVALSRLSYDGATHRVALVADDTRGLQILEVSDAAAPVLLATLDTPGSATSVTSDGSYAYVADGASGVQIVDLWDPRTPVAMGFDTSGTAWEAVANDKALYVADGSSGVQVLDITYLDAPRRIGGYDTAGTAYAIVVHGKYAYIADGTQGVQILDISTPGNPTLAGSYDTAGTALDLDLVGDRLYVADGASGVQVLDVSNPGVPVFIKTVRGAFPVSSVAVSGNYALVQNNGTLQALRVVPNVDPIGVVEISGTAKQMQTLTASNTLTDADGLGPIIYTWKAGATVLGTGVNYVLKPADAGKTLTVTASYTDQGATTESVTSAAFGPIIGNERPIGVVTINGKPIQGQILTASHNLSDPDVIRAETLTYTWKTGATLLGTGTQYQLTSAEAGKTVTVSASYTDQAGTLEIVTSGNTATVIGNVAPTGTVTITGELMVGKTLSAQNNLADDNGGTGAITYTWKSGIRVVATGANYTLTSSDVGRTFFVVASYVDGGGVKEEVRSAPTGVIGNNNLPQGTVSISDTTPVVGQTLSASDTLSDADGLGAMTYTWKTGATLLESGKSYTVTAAELGKTLTVTASYTDQLGHAESITSVATSAVAEPEQPGVIITPESATTSEVRGSSNAQFAVVLNTQPRENVTITFASNNESEGKVSGNNVLTFTNSNWNIAQTLIVQGVDDVPNDVYEKSGTAYQVNGKLSSTDIDYIRGITVPVLTLVNADDPKDAPKVESGDQNPSNLRDFLVGGNCADILSGIEDIDFLYGGRGDDRLTGGNDDDRLYGEEGNDRLNGDNGFDSLDGGVGNDILNGGNEDDTLIGGNGKDTLIGDPGADIFIYNSIQDSGVGSSARDVISDFSSAQGDKIDLHLIGAQSFITGNFTNHAGEVRFDSVNHLLQFDNNGDAKADLEIELTGMTQLNVSDLTFS